MWHGTIHIRSHAGFELPALVALAHLETAFEHRVGLVESRMDVQRWAGEERRGGVIADDCLAFAVMIRMRFPATSISSASAASGSAQRLAVAGTS